MSTHGDDEKGGVSRRGFLGGVAGFIGVTAVGSTAEATPVPKAEIYEASGLSKLTLQVNGRTHSLLVEPRWTLLYVLRDRLGLTGTKPGCERGECGACTVLFDGVTRYSCMTLALEAEGHEITTIEGIMAGEALGPVQQSFADEDAFQCGYCTPGQIVAVEGLLRQNASPSIDEVREGVSGNLCRCGAYGHIFKAAMRAAAMKQVS
ncbi:MAG: (2Fe-2S)-binding protein [Acidobacteria bacterium]|nr:(2Fe-2S)-binding protein [Acidobacteriota bacterium]